MKTILGTLPLVKFKAKEFGVRFPFTLDVLLNRHQVLSEGYHPDRMKWVNNTLEFLKLFSSESIYTDCNGIPLESFPLDKKANQKEKCNTCKGRGFILEDQLCDVPDPFCNGTGKKVITHCRNRKCDNGYVILNSVLQDHAKMRIGECYDCKKSGFIYVPRSKEICNYCNGEGIVTVKNIVVQKPIICEECSGRGREFFPATVPNKELVRSLAEVLEEELELKTVI